MFFVTFASVKFKLIFNAPNVPKTFGYFGYKFTDKSENVNYEAGSRLHMLHFLMNY